MSWLSRIFGRTSDGSAATTTTSADGALWLYVRCERCGEAIRVRLRPRTDAQPEYDEGGNVSYYLLRKEILGNRCPNLMNVELHLDRRDRIVEQQAERCAIITQADYEAARQAQPS